MKEVKIEDLYQISKKAYSKTIDLKIQLEFLMKQISDYEDNLNETDNNRHVGELPTEPN